MRRTQHSSQRVPFPDWRRRGTVFANVRRGWATGHSGGRGEGGGWRNPGRLHSTSAAPRCGRRLVEPLRFQTACALLDSNAARSHAKGGDGGQAAFYGTTAVKPDVSGRGRSEEQGTRGLGNRALVSLRKYWNKQTITDKFSTPFGPISSSKKIKSKERKRLKHPQ